MNGADRIFADMAGYFRIFPDHNLVYVRYSGAASIADYVAVIDGYTNHADYDPHRKNLVDLRALDSFERDYTAALALQARIAEYALTAQADILSVMVAPSPVALEVAKLITRSWEGIDSPVIRRIVPSMNEAATLLGIGQDTLDGLLKQVA